MNKKISSSTPLMEQYLAIKAKHQDKILLYRMGDFYETFYEDAKKISQILGIALTKRSHGKAADVPLAGFPYHALETYLPKLIDSGNKVAICEQVEDPQLAKTVVKREVIEIVTPGTTLSEKLLDRKSNNYLAAVTIAGNTAGLSYCDISTGEYYVSETSLERMLDYLQQIGPKEVLVSSSDQEQLTKLFQQKLSALITRLDEWIFQRSYAYEILIDHFRTPNLKGFGLEELTSGVTAAGAVLYYLKENYQSKITHLSKISFLPLDDYMVLDNTTRRNLEISSSIIGGRSEGTLIAILDQTVTPMGGRLLKRWILHPLIRLEHIQDRLDKVEVFFHNPQLRQKIRQSLSEMSDLERLMSRVSTGRATPRDLIALKTSLNLIPAVKELLMTFHHPLLNTMADKLIEVNDVFTLLEASIVSHPPLSTTEGGIIKDGYNSELDELRTISREGKNWLIKLQQEERERSHIPTLKLGYNRVFGYYFEVSKSQQTKVPEYFIRKQTLVNGERYITPQLKEYEDKILGAEEKICELEYRLFQDIRNRISEWGEKILQNAELLAELDCVANLAEVAVQNNYVKPVIDNNSKITIRQGRHPVVEKLLPPDQTFIENDTELDNQTTQIMILTGPNMAGKSTYLRQVGLICLMAQCGSFVPAREAHLGIVDRIFTRVGATDNLAFGESTFLVEMLETANILNNATPRSLVILDEIGRGTSTFDGLSIAWAVTEFLHNEKRVAAKTLFATHYHELTELEMLYPRIKNYRVTVKEIEDSVIFLRKIERGGVDNSYGIHVAQMAGLPREVIERAREVLYNLEASEISTNHIPRLATRRSGVEADRSQLNIFEFLKKSAVEEELKKVNIENLTPLEALIKLNELKKIMTDANK